MIIAGKGHPNITAKHATTIAFTRDKSITLRGDCFVAVCCGWSISSVFLKRLRTAEKVTVEIECLGEKDTITGSGHPDLTPTEKDLVIRKSDWVDSRTLMINADKAAKDLNGGLVQALKQPAPVTITVSVE